MRGNRGLLGLALVWTLIMLVIGVVLAVQAMVSLNDGQQACFFNYPAVA
jgi:Tfp pilus assembly protein PilX